MKVELTEQAEDIEGIVITSTGGAFAVYFSEPSMRCRVTLGSWTSAYSRPFNSEIVLHRLAALLMLLTITFSSAETVVGLLRDGAVHHESSAEAATHALMAQGEHGHEDGAQHGPNHEHGTPADHCTHQHGPVFSPRSPVFVVLSHTVPVVFLEPSLWLDHLDEPSFRPPQA